LNVAALPIEDRWMLSRVSRAAVEVQDALLKFQFSRAINLARDFFWDALCDWYLELVKGRIKDDRHAAEARRVLAFALDQSLRLLHPFIPFITERLWEQLNEIAPQRGIPGAVELDTGRPLLISPYPPVEGYPGLTDAEADAVFADLQTATRAVRDIRQTQNVPPKQTVDVAIRVPAGRVASLEHEARVIQQLASVGELTIAVDAPKPPNAATLVIGDMHIFVANVIDPAAERQRLEKELAGIDKQIAGIHSKLDNESFTRRAPAGVVQRERGRVAELSAKRETVLVTLSELG
jgi:valyl-tRNA synthetase